MTFEPVAVVILAAMSIKMLSHWVEVNDWERRYNLLREAPQTVPEV